MNGFFYGELGQQTLFHPVSCCCLFNWKLLLGNIAGKHPTQTSQESFTASRQVDGTRLSRQASPTAPPASIISLAWLWFWLQPQHQHMHTRSCRSYPALPQPKRLAMPPDEPSQPADHQPPAGPAAPQTLLVTKRFRVVRVDESCRDGTLRTREIVEHPGSVLIVPLLADDQICLIRNVRRAVGATLWELPAGTLDREEPIAAAARRELEEETGYRADALEEVPGLWMSPGILRERMHVFVARGLTPGPQALEPGETIDTHVVAWSEAVAMCLDGRIDDAKTVAAILRLEAQRQQTG
jgi:ADP-ribose pyrophosphatase